MALKAYEGFGHYNGVSTDFLSRSGWLQWTAINSSSSFVTPGPQGTGKYLKAYIGDSNAGPLLYGSWATNLATFYTGHRLNLPSGNGGSFEYWDNTGNGKQFVISMNVTTCAVQLQDNDSNNLALSANNVFAVGTWFYLEVGATVATSGGSVVVKINGTTVLSYTGKTQYGTGNAWVNGMVYRTTANEGSMGLADMYFCDSTTGAGTYPMNTFLSTLGDPRVFYNPPASNSTVQFTPLTSSNYIEVGETAMDSDTSYNYSSTDGDYDLFNPGTSWPTMSVVLAVGVINASRKDNSGNRSLENVLVSGTTTAEGNSNPANTSYTYFNDFWVEDPNTSASWTVTNAQTVEFGYEISV